MGQFNKSCEHDTYQGFLKEHLTLFDAKQHKGKCEVKKKFIFNLIIVALLSSASKGLSFMEMNDKLSDSAIKYSGMSVNMLFDKSM